MSQTATATCFCGNVQLEVAVEGPNFVDAFVCHCLDCNKITASTFASNFIVKDEGLKHLRGEDKLTSWGQNRTIGSGNTMTNYFCSVCGTLLYRVSSGYPGLKIPRIGTVDDVSLHETKLKPTIEQWRKRKAAWVGDIQGIEHYADGEYDGRNL